ncbi:MAG: hypothetical protein AAF990_23615 [Bacteroidota bacterium]
MKLNNYNFDLNPRKPSAEQVNKHKDFDALLSRYEEESPKVVRHPRSRMLYVIGAAAAAAVLGFFFINAFFNQNNYGAEAEEYFASQPYVNPPKLNIAPSYQKHTFNTNKASSFKLENGSQLNIPQDAFVDAQGQPVRGSVDVKYREFHDYVDFFLSGIPMEYDSAGVRYLLESAGMIEIYAEKDGQRVNIAPGKEIKVELVSEVLVSASEADKAPDYNIYVLDQINRNWVYKGKDAIEVLSEERPTNVGPEDVMKQKYQKSLDQIARKNQEELAKIEATIPVVPKPTKPEKANEEHPVFELNFEDVQLESNPTASGTQKMVDEVEDDLAELRKQYANSMWQVNPAKNPDFNRAAAAGIDWESMRLKPLNGNDFELTLIYGDNQMKLIVDPVLSGTDYDNAIEKFNDDMKVYLEKIAEREAALASLKDELSKEIQREKDIANLEYEQQIAAYRADGKDYAANKVMIRRKILNRFTASSFGIWNCDRPLPPFMVKVKGEFVDIDRKSSYAENTAYLVDKSLNTVCRYYTGKGVEVAYNKKSDNLLWLLTSDNKIAIMRPDEFKRISQGDGSHATFVMDLVDKEIKSEEDIRKILEF